MEVCGDRPQPGLQGLPPPAVRLRLRLPDDLLRFRQGQPYASFGRTPTFRGRVDPPGLDSGSLTRPPVADLPPGGPGSDDQRRRDRKSKLEAGANLPGTMFDEHNYKRSLSELKRFPRDLPSAVITAGHETAHLRNAPARLGVVIPRRQAGPVGTPTTFRAEEEAPPTRPQGSWAQSSGQAPAPSPSRATPASRRVALLVEAVYIFLT